MNLESYSIDLNICLGEDFSEYEFSEEGIPLTRFNRKPDWQHNPITVCQYGLHHFIRYLKTQDEKSKEIFLIQAEWLANHAEKGIDDSVVWYYRVEVPLYKISGPWISGMAQGEAISLMLRAYQLTENKKYLEIAHGAWKCFNIPVAKGGIISYFPDGKPVIEEYPSPKYLTAVLNGFIFGIVGVYEYGKATNDNEANDFYLKLIDSLKHNLERYDCGYWSYYDLKPPLRLASKAYHRLHIEQLNVLYEMTGEEIFKIYRDKWRKYLSSSQCNLRWLIRKVYQKLFFPILKKLKYP